MNFTDREKQLLMENAPVYSRIRLYDEDGSVLQIFNEDDYLIDWDYEDYRYVPDQGFIGQFVARILDGHFMNIPDNISLEDKEIELEIAVKDPELEEQVYHSYGRFIITKIEKEDASGSYKFEASDYTKKFNVTYESSVNYPCLAIELLNDAANRAEVYLEGNDTCLAYAVTENGLSAGNYCFAAYVGDTLTYFNFTTERDLSYRDSLMLVASKGKVIQRVVNEDYSVTETEIVYASSTTQVGTLLSNEELSYVDFINNNFVIEDNQFVENNSCREVVSAIAKLGYTWARIGTDNKLHLDFVKKSEEDVDSYDEIDTDKYYEATVTGDTIKPINKVLLGMSQVEGENIVKEQDNDLLGVDTIYGETSQETYSGKNLMDLTTNSTSGGVTVVADYNSARVTSSSTVTDNKVDVGSAVLSAGTYTMMLERLSGNDVLSGWVYYKGSWDRPTTTSLGLPSGSSQASLTFTISEQKTICWGLYSPSGRTYSGSNFRVSIVKGSTADFNFERYYGGSPSPNPDFPQDVKTVRGNNNLKIANKNMLRLLNYIEETRNGVTLSVDDDGTFTLNGTATANADFIKWYAIETKANIPYTLNIIYVSGSATGRVGIYNEDGNHSWQGWDLVTNITENVKVTHTLDYDMNLTTRPIRVFNGVTYNNLKFQVQFTQGENADYMYEQHQEKLQPLNFPVENLFDIKNTPITQNSLTNAGITLTFNDDGTIIANGTNTGTYRFIRYNFELPAGTYYFSGCAKGGSLNGYSTLIETPSGIFDYGDGATFTLTQTTTVKFYPIRIGSQTVTFNNVVFKPMIARVPVRYDDYTPYWYDENLFDKDNANYVNGWITNTTMRLNTTNGNRMFYIPCKTNTTYTISRSIITSSFRTTTYDSTPFPTVTSSNVDYTVPTVIENNSGTTLTITTGANAKYLVVHYGKIEDTNLNETLASIQIKEHIKTLELCKIGNYQDYITKNTGANIFKPTLTCEGTAIVSPNCTPALIDDEYILTARGSDMYFSQIVSSGIAYVDYIGPLYETNNAEKIYFYCTNPLINKNYITWYDENKISLGYEGGSGNNNKRFNVPINAKYFTVRFGYGSATSDTIYRTRVMVSYTPITEYEPYGSGEWYEYHNIGKYTLTGTSGENWYISGNSLKINNLKDFGYIPSSANYSRQTTDGIFSNYGTTDTGENVYNGSVSKIGLGSSLQSWGGTNQDCMYVSKGELTVADFKTKLATNNLICYYVLANPDVRKITYQPLIDQLNELQNAGLFEGTNHITIDTLNEKPSLDITVTDLEQDSTSYSGKSFEITGHDYDKGGSIYIYDNPLTHSEELRRIAINGAEKLYGLTYTPMTINSIGHPWLEGDDFVKLTNLEENDLYTYPFDRKLEYKGYLVTDLSSATNNQVQEKYENPNNVLNRLNHTEISVDKANQRIDLIAEQTSGNTQNITNMQLDINGINQSVQHIENTEIAGLQSQISTVNQTMNAITNMFQISGGINVIRNSAFLLQDAVWEFTNNGTNPYYTPLGSSYNVVLSGTTTSVAEIKLRSVKVKSKSENVTNLILGTKYTFNFYHKQDNNMTTTIKMYSTENNNVKAFDDIVITGQQGFRNYEVSFTPTTYANYTIEIIVTSTASVGYAYIYDMMLNSGDKQSWQPASDEIYSTTLQMSRLGLQVYSVGDGTITILGSDGMATYETTDGKTLGRLVSLRNIDGDRTRVITTQAVYLTRDITQENDNKWVETIVNISGSPYKVEYVESGE